MTLQQAPSTQHDDGFDIHACGNHVRMAFLDEHSGMDTLDTTEKRAEHLAEVLFVSINRRPASRPQNADEMYRFIDREIQESGWEDVTREDVFREYRFLRSEGRYLGYKGVSDATANAHGRDFGIHYPKGESAT